MTTDTAFEAANKKVHPVATQWHHPVLTARGFVPETQEATGLVRHYDYVHPAGHRIRCTTGTNSDCWTHSNATPTKVGYWDSLEQYLNVLLSPVKPAGT